MQANVLPARRGVSWLRTGFGLWRANPLPLTSSAMTMCMCLLLAAVLPQIGNILFFLLLPVFSVGMFMCCDTLAKGRRIVPAQLFAHFTDHLRRLVGFASLRLLGDFACFFLALALAGLSFKQLTPPPGASAEVANAYVARLMPVVGWTLLLRVPLEMATWFAAPLIALQHLSLVKALFFSFVACWRNLGALFVFLLAYALCGGLLPGLFVNLVAGFSPVLASILLAPLLMMLIPLFFTSFYTSAREIFGEWPDA